MLRNIHTAKCSIADGAAIHTAKDSSSCKQHKQHSGTRKELFYTLSALLLFLKLYQQRCKLCGCDIAVYYIAVHVEGLRVVMLWCVLQLALWFVRGWGDGGKWWCVLQLALWIVTGWEIRREMVMCAAVSVMVCYREGDTEGNGDVCCS